MFPKFLKKKKKGYYLALKGKNENHWLVLVQEVFLKRTDINYKNLSIYIPMCDIFSMEINLGKNFKFRSYMWKFFPLNLTVLKSVSNYNL